MYQFWLSWLISFLFILPIRCWWISRQRHRTLHHTIIQLVYDGWIKFGYPSLISIVSILICAYQITSVSFMYDLEKTVFKGSSCWWSPSIITVFIWSTMCWQTDTPHHTIKQPSLWWVYNNQFTFTMILWVPYKQICNHLCQFLCPRTHSTNLMRSHKESRMLYIWGNPFQWGNKYVISQCHSKVHVNFMFYAYVYIIYISF